MKPETETPRSLAVNAGSALFVPLKREYFEAFASGKKREEYRPYGPRWNEKTCRIGRRVVLSLGYGKQRRLTGTITSFDRSGGITRTAAWLACYGDKFYTTAACIGITLDQQNASDDPRAKRVGSGRLLDSDPSTLAQ